MADEVNHELRAHVTRVGFDLTLGKTHIAALVHIDQMLKENRHINTRVSFGPFRKAFANFATGAHGLEDRGLLIHTHPDMVAFRRRRKSGDASDYPVRKIWRITKAGRLVISLLKEAGIYEEYLAALPMSSSAAEAS